jgi:hypothetical protein
MAYVKSLTDPGMTQSLIEVRKSLLSKEETDTGPNIHDEVSMNHDGNMGKVQRVHRGKDIEGKFI